MTHHRVWRKGPKRTELIDAVGDHAILALKGFERTGDPSHLCGREFIDNTALDTPNGTMWAYSPQLSHVPPDIDDTSAALLFSAIAGMRSREGMAIDLTQFSIVQQPSGGLLTYLERGRNEADPTVNTLAAFALLYGLPHSGLLAGVQTFLNTTLCTLTPSSSPSPYYVGTGYFMLRAAKLETYSPGFFTTQALSRLDDCIWQYSPPDALSMAMTSSAASYRRLIERTAALNEQLRGMPWDFCTFYTQRRSPYSYGSPFHTATFAQEALALEEDSSRIAPHRDLFNVN